jgi:hypothetical protein
VQLRGVTDIGAVDESTGRKATGYRHAFPGTVHPGEADHKSSFVTTPPGRSKY